MGNSSKRVKWIDAAKTVAWGGVMTQHVNHLFYCDQRIFKSTWYAVALFIMIGGYLTACSYEKKGTIDIRQRTGRLLLTYSAATVIYVFYQERYLDVEGLFLHIIHFDASGPFYYIWVYCQLLVISPVLEGALNWADAKGIKGYVRRAAVLTAVLSICYFNVTYTSAFQLSSSGGHLGGGIWLFYWYMGMRMKAVLDCEFKHPKAAFGVSIFLLCIWEYIFIFKDYIVCFQAMFGDTQISGLNWMHALQTVLVLFAVKSGMACIENRGKRIWDIVIRVFCFIGRNTLYIFLYHLLFLDIGMKLWPGQNVFGRRLFLGILMTAGPLCLKYMRDIVYKWCQLYIKVK